jgi:hypothetical protein
MVDNGLQRGGEFSPGAVAKRWETLLYATLPPLAASIPRWQRRPWGRRLVGSVRKLRSLFSGVPRK